MTAKQSLGEYCHRLGLSAQHLIDKLPAIKDDDLINGVGLEIIITIVLQLISVH